MRGQSDAEFRRQIEPKLQLGWRFQSTRTQHGQQDAEFKRLAEWLGPASDSQVQRRIEDRLDRHSRPARRRLILILLLVALCIWAASSKAGPLQLSCTPRAQEFDIEGRPTTITAYEVFTGPAANALEPLAKVPACSYDASSTAPGKWFFAWRQYNVIGPSELGPVNSFTIAAAPKLLVTVGGDVFLASPNWSNFSWKLGGAVGTVAKGIKCDAARKIGEDWYRVTSAIVWTAAKKDYVVARCAV